MASPPNSTASPLSWEGGLRGEAYAERMFDSLERMREALGARHCVHLRFETHHVGGVETAQEWIRQGRVRFLALNDHLPGMARRLGDDRKLLQYANRAECDLDTFQARIRQAMAAADAVADAMRELTACAQAAGLKVASHDDPDAATRRYYHQLGCGVAEFPLTREAAGVARDLGDAIVFGGPNVVRGGSHTNAPNATDMIRAGLCDILTSDYYYPAPLAAAMRLAHDGVLPLPQAWDLISRNPPARRDWTTAARSRRACWPTPSWWMIACSACRACVRNHRGRRIALRHRRLPGPGRRVRRAPGGLTVMPLAHRYALYLAPSGPWQEQGSRWLGRCAETGAALERQPGMPAAAQEWTRAPRHYGLHATLKPLPPDRRRRAVECGPGRRRAGGSAQRLRHRTGMRAPARLPGLATDRERPGGPRTHSRAG